MEVLCYNGGAELISIEFLLQKDASISGWNMQIWPSLRHPHHPNEQSIKNTVYMESSANTHFLKLLQDSLLKQRGKKGQSTSTISDTLNPFVDKKQVLPK